MSNRCQQSALNSLKKLNDIITRKYKREGTRNDPQTENIVKLNIAILMTLQGRRDGALVVLREVYHHRNCFIEFMQTRVFLLLLVPASISSNSTSRSKTPLTCWRSTATTCSGPPSPRPRTSNGCP